MRSRLCKACSAFHPVDSWPLACYQIMESKRSALGVPYIRGDGMGETWNPVDGKHYDSRSAYERAVKDAGCQIVGTDSALERPYVPEKPVDATPDIINAIRKHGG